MIGYHSHVPMFQSALFSKTQREAPKDEQSKNAQLLIRAGYINKEMAGVYSYLPLGLRVIEKIRNIIRKEMNAIGGQEVLLTTLQDPDIWKKTDRWDDMVVDNWFKTTLKNGTELGIANTHEEALVELLQKHVSSYKDLPLYIYQFQTKFRNELRAKSGLMRCREFLMKDLYSFSKNDEDFTMFYERCAEAYMNIFQQVGLGEITYRTLAAGGSFTKGFTDEFQTITDAGEDTIYVSEERKRAINKEVYEEGIKELGVEEQELKEYKAVEVGNIFPLGTKYTEALGLTYKDESGEEKPIIMGSYGIGLGRLMGVIAEVFADDKGLVWPRAVAPFDVHILKLSDSSGANEQLQELQSALEAQGLELLIDNRNISVGQKLTESDLIGIPLRIIVSDKTIESGKYEMKYRNSDLVEYGTLDEIVAKVE